MKQWKIRRRALLVGALIILVIFVGIHLASDFDINVGGIDLAGGVGEDINSVAGLPSNMRMDTTPVVATSILSATSILGHDVDIYLDGTLPSLR